MEETPTTEHPQNRGDSLRVERRNTLVILSLCLLLVGCTNNNPNRRGVPVPERTRPMQQIGISAEGVATDLIQTLLLESFTHLNMPSRPREQTTTHT